MRSSEIVNYDTVSKGQGFYNGLNAQTVYPHLPEPPATESRCKMPWGRKKAAMEKTVGIPAAGNYTLTCKLISHNFGVSALDIFPPVNYASPYIIIDDIVYCCCLTGNACGNH